MGPAKWAVVFVKDGERNVDPLDDLGVAHGHICIGRSIRDYVAGEAIAYTEEVQADGVVDTGGHDSVLLDWIDGDAEVTLGDATDGKGLVHAVRPWLRQLGQLAHRGRHGKANRLAHCGRGRGVVLRESASPQVRNSAIKHNVTTDKLALDFMFAPFGVF